MKINPTNLFIVQFLVVPGSLLHLQGIPTTGDWTEEEH